MMKKKSILMLAAAAAVLCAVLCAAGCVGSADEDEADVLGTWYHGDDKLEVFMTFADDGTGIICCLKDDNGTLKLNVPLPYVNDIIWNAEGDNIYLLFDNGAETSYTIDETTGKLTSQKFGIVYEPVELTDEEDDGVSDVWYYETETSAEVAVDFDDNTGIGYLVEQKKDKDGNLIDELIGTEIPYTWKKNADGTFEVINEDGTVSQSTLDAQKQSVTNSSGKDFTRMPNTGAAFIKLMSWSADRLFPHEEYANVTGDWFHGDDKLEVLISLNEDGTGMIACFKDDDNVLKLGVPVPYVNDVLWDREGDSVSVLFDNIAETSYTLDKETGKLTSKQFGIVYKPIHAPKVEDEKLNPVGTWYTDDGNFEAFLIFLEDGTGVYTNLKDKKNEHNISSAAEFVKPLVWSGSNGIVKVTIDGGDTLEERTLSGVIDLVSGNLFTSHHTVYERVSLSESAGQFEGTWHFDDGQSAGILIVAEDNKGIFICLKDETGRYWNNDDVLPQHELFIWDEKDGTLSDHYEDGIIVTAVIDKKTGKLVDSFDVAYERIA